MPLPNLVGDARAQSITALAALNSGPRSDLLASASAQIRSACNRDFSYGFYSELYSGGDHRYHDPLRLRQFPVARVTRVACNPVNVLLVSNNGSTCQRATVETLEDGSGVRLQYQINGATLQTQDFLYSTSTTLATLATAITAFGNGFTATVATGVPNIDVTKYSSADLWPLQGAISCMGPGAYLTLYVEDIQPFGNLAWRDGDCDWIGSNYGWRLDGDTGEVYGRFPRGDLNIRFDYYAGFTQIPDDVQQATLIVAKYLYDAGNVNHTMKSATLGRAQVVLGTVTGAIPGPAYGLIRSYIAHDKIINRN